MPCPYFFNCTIHMLYDRLNAMLYQDLRCLLGDICCKRMDMDDGSIRMLLDQCAVIRNKWNIDAEFIGELKTISICPSRCQCNDNASCLCSQDSGSCLRCNLPVRIEKCPVNVNNQQLDLLGC